MNPTPEEMRERAKRILSYPGELPCVIAARRRKRNKHLKTLALVIVTLVVVAVGMCWLGCQ